MAQLKLYYTTELETKISLQPNQLNNNIDTYILDNLKIKVEKKTQNNGIVIRVNKLISYENGIIDKTNFMGITVIPVKYECFICSPVSGLELVCELQQIIKGYMICRNGPIIIAVQFNNIDPQKFTISGDGIVYAGTRLMKGDHLKVSLISFNNNLGEKEIVSMGKLLNMATKDEVKQFNSDQEMLSSDNNAVYNDFI